VQGRLEPVEHCGVRWFMVVERARLMLNFEPLRMSAHFAIFFGAQADVQLGAGYSPYESENR
jgi:hypothetical protein